MTNQRPPFFPTTGRYLDNKYYEIDPTLVATPTQVAMFFTRCEERRCRSSRRRRQTRMGEDEAAARLGPRRRCRLQLLLAPPSSASRLQFAVCRGRRNPIRPARCLWDEPSRSERPVLLDDHSSSQRCWQARRARGAGALRSPRGPRSSAWPSGWRVTRRWRATSRRTRSCARSAGWRTFGRRRRWRRGCIRSRRR